MYHTVENRDENCSKTKAAGKAAPGPRRGGVEGEAKLLLSTALYVSQSQSSNCTVRNRRLRP